jgi:hypothetical protein
MDFASTFAMLVFKETGTGFRTVGVDIWFIAFSPFQVALLNNATLDYISKLQ